MSENEHFDLDDVLARFALALIMVAAATYLIPTLFYAVWTVMPGVLLIVLIVSVLRAMVGKLLD